jgi:hypothetical protein
VKTLLNRPEDILVQIGGAPGCPHSTFRKLHVGINTGLIVVKPWAVPFIRQINRYEVDKFEHHCHEQELFNKFVAEHGTWVKFPSKMMVQTWTLGMLNFSVWPGGVHNKVMRVTRNYVNHDFAPLLPEQVCIHHDMEKAIIQKA